ncbi:MAG: hypothetical protein EHM28_04655 [Spirochaetaceae bacterium]|nr:MAG: hypothetical protein EHM28_04655 [Spirochaetaceae bacterium]
MRVICTILLFFALAFLLLSCSRDSQSQQADSAVSALTSTADDETRPLTDEEIREMLINSQWYSNEYNPMCDLIIIFEKDGRFSEGSYIFQFGNYSIQNGKITCSPDKKTIPVSTFYIERLETNLASEMALVQTDDSGQPARIRYFRLSPGIRGGLARIYEGIPITTVATESFLIWGKPVAYVRPDVHSEQLPYVGESMRDNKVLGRTEIDGQTWYLIKMVEAKGPGEVNYWLVWILESAVYPSLIDRYYSYLHDTSLHKENLEAAYELWHKKTSYEDFAAMYSDVNFCRILDIKYEGGITWIVLIELEFTDKTKKTYRVTMTVDDTHIVDSKSVEVP